MDENSQVFSFEESVEKTIASKQAEINQMERMIAENKKSIKKGERVKFCTSFNEQLTAEIAQRQMEIDKLSGLPSRQDSIQLQEELRKAYLLLYGRKD